jgi:hypothetical protein
MRANSFPGCSKGIFQEENVGQVMSYPNFGFTKYLEEELAR